MESRKDEKFIATVLLLLYILFSWWDIFCWNNHLCIIWIYFQAKGINLFSFFNLCLIKCYSLLDFYWVVLCNLNEDRNVPLRYFMKSNETKAYFPLSIGNKHCIANIYTTWNEASWFIYFIIVRNYSKTCIYAYIYIYLNIGHLLWVLGKG